MMPTYQNPQVLKQPFMPTVRPSGVVPGRPNGPYPTQTMPQPQTSQQQQPQGQPSQMPVSYINEQGSMMVSSAGANSMPPNVNR
ncbi:unnamed protein product, partial [Rotaria socialis]